MLALYCSYDAPRQGEGVWQAAQSDSLQALHSPDAQGGSTSKWLLQGQFSSHCIEAILYGVIYVVWWVFGVFKKNR